MRNVIPPMLTILVN